MPDNLTLGEKIAFFRKKAGFTQQEIADELDVSRSLVGQIEKNLTKPNLDFLSGFVKKTGIKYEYLLDGNQLVDELNRVSETGNLTIEKREDTPIPNSDSGWLTRVVSDFRTFLFSIFEVYDLILDPVYSQLGNYTLDEKRKKLINEFSNHIFVQSQISKGVLEVELIELIIDNFLKRKLE